MTNKVEFGTLADKNAVFVWFYAKGRPYKDYMDGSYDKEIPLVLAQFRWDGKIGAIGGGVDKGETLRDALWREVQEETGVKNYYWLDPKRLVSHHILLDTGITFGVHAYYQEIDEHTMYEIQRKAIDAKDYKAEVSGYCVLHCREDAINEIAKNNFVGTARTEFKMLLDKINESC